MSSFSRSAIQRGALVVSLLIFGAWVGYAARSSPAKPATPASTAIVKKVSEADLGTIVLSEEAEARLGVATKPVERKDVRSVRIYGGEAMAPLGRTIAVAAPMQGAVRAIGNDFPHAGKQVSKGDKLFALAPLLSPDATTTLTATRADIEGQVKGAEAQLQVAQLALERARKLFQQEAGSKRGVEEAQGQYDVATQTLSATQSRLKVLDKALGDARTGRAEPIELEAPESGILRSITVMPEQNVPAGAPLFEVVDTTEMWIRVPVYVGDLREIQTGADALVGDMSMRAGQSGRAARAIAAPPSANPLSSTVDLYFSLPNDAPQLTPGQRVAAQLPLALSGDSLVVPWAAVLTDLQGANWVYERKSPRTYRRQRVLLKAVVDGVAVLATGPTVGAEVVVEGAVELFGAETGFSK